MDTADNSQLEFKWTRIRQAFYNAACEKYGKNIATITRRQVISVIAGTEINWPYWLTDNFQESRGVYKFPETGSQGVDIFADEEDDVMVVEQDSPDLENRGVNRIFFGPPGTGKTHKVDGIVVDEWMLGEKNIFRVTFHPEYTYTDFVGCYKPVMAYGGVEQYVDEERNPLTCQGRPTVVYRFVPGPFAEILKRALEAEKVQKPAEQEQANASIAPIAQDRQPVEMFAFIIEEINRGNCAAIFGDLFQLLDRNEKGQSKWPINADGHLSRYLGLKDQDGEKLRIPSNLAIFATMNTSDQSLYPMDSAFKRRWEMTYVPISYEYKDVKERKVVLSEKENRDWKEVLETLNRAIVEKTGTDDKQLGPWFIPGTNPISAKQFRDKVLSYLWFDVFRHNPADFFEGDIRSFDDLVREYDGKGLKVIKAFAQSTGDSDLVEESSTTEASN